MKKWLLFSSVLFFLLIFGMVNHKTALLDLANVTAIEIAQSGNSEIVTIEKRDNYFEALVMLYNVALKENISLKSIDVESSFTVMYQVTNTKSKQIRKNFLMLDKNGIVLVGDRLIAQKMKDKESYQFVRECFITKN